jgi:antitoxin (DNA-binding transcriptional repressor) of toxin-antitoxin stability system
LKNNLSASLEQVRNGEELVVKDRNTPIARLMPFAEGLDLDVKEEALVTARLMRLPLDQKSNRFLDYPAPQVSSDVIRAVIREERDEN